MKRGRVVLILAVTLGLLGLALYWAPRDRGFATPAECLEAYRDACKEGDVAKLMNCLDQPLRSSTNETPESAREKMRGVKSWTQHGPEFDGAVARVEVDEIGPEGASTVRFRLEKTSRGWLIVGIEPPRAMQTGPRYGTDVRDVPEK